MKKCPYCAEEIQDAAIVCRYCGREQNKPVSQVHPTPQTALRQSKAPRKSSRLVTAGSLVVLLCLLCIVASAIQSIFSPEEEEVTTATAGISSNVVINTFTPSETDTPKPTRTPLPSRTPRPPADPYILEASEKFQDYYAAYLDVNSYVQQMVEDPTLMFDYDWKIDTGLALGLLNFRADALADLEPSPAFEKTHSYMVELAFETHLFTDAFAKGIDNIDADAINEATVHVNNITRILGDATVELERIGNSQ